MNELLIRAITGAVYVGLTLAAGVAGPFTTQLLFLPVALIAVHEFCRLASRDEPIATGWTIALALVTYVCVSTGSWLPDLEPWYLAALLFMILVITITWMLIRGTSDPVRELGIVLLALTYVTVPFALLPYLVSWGFQLYAGVFILLWTNDTGAYLFGKLLGRHKLLPSVSPGKTVEGLLGGVAATLVVAYVLARVWPVMPLHDWMICGAMVAVSATVGDLLESAMKRTHGVKDSGTMLPGHGGILDRFDGFLLALPAVFVYLALAH